MSLPDWADTPDAADDRAAMTEDAAEDKRDHRALAAGIDAPTDNPLCTCRGPLCDPHCWGLAFEQAYRAANTRPGDAA